MRFEINTTNNGFKLTGHNWYHGSFEYHFKKYSELIAKMKKMKATLDKNSK